MTLMSIMRACLGLALLVALAQGLVVTKFPHFQTFDSWDTCNYAGTCYEQECTNLPAGWTNVPIAAVSFYDQTRNWWIIQGETSSNVDYKTGKPFACNDVKTGPCTDHTGKDGKYAYTEASGCYGSVYEFYSPTIVYSNNTATVSFYYFMYGADMDASEGKASLTLSMKALNASSPAWVDVVSFTGQQQTSSTDDWGFHKANLDSLLPATASTSAPMAVQFRFRTVSAGTRGLTKDFFLSDIALDDVLFTQSGAPEDATPYIDPTSSTTPTPTPGGGTTGGSSGLEDWEIGAIVGGILGGLLLLALLLAAAVIILLLIISPRRSMQKMRSSSTSSSESDSNAAPNPLAPPPTDNHRHSIVM